MPCLVFIKEFLLFIKSTTFGFPNLITSTKFTGMKSSQEKPDQNMLEVNAFDGQQILRRPLEIDKKIIFKNTSLTLRQ